MKDWTIMVYMAGDNNLSENMVYALDEIDKFRSELPEKDRDKINMLAFFDGSSPTAPTYYIDYTPEETFFHEIIETDFVSREATDSSVMDVKNAASPHSLINFVNWCINTRKCAAAHYAFILSGHSSGFYGNTMMADFGSNAYMTIFDLRSALENIKKNYLSGNKIDILGFDSCLMSMLEIGYELKDVAKTIVASEGNLPNAGWTYVPMFEKLIITLAEHNCEEVKEKSLDAKAAAKCFVEGFIEQQKKYAIGGRSVDLAAWDLDEVDTVVSALKKLAESLIDKFDLSKLAEKRKLTREDIFVYEELKKIILQSHIVCQTFMHDQCVDLKDFCEQLALECNCLEEHLNLLKLNSKTFNEIKTKSGDVIRAIGKCVLKSGFCGDEYQFSNGISLYFPWTARALISTRTSYSYLNFVRGINSEQSELESALKAALKEQKDNKTEKGAGKSWYDFLFCYLFIVTMRRTRNNSEDFETYFNNLKNSPATKENWFLSTKENWFLNTKENWILKTRGDLSAAAVFCNQFRNYQLDWEISGFSDARSYDENLMKCKYLDLIARADDIKD